jgi:hypothetical protein
MIPAAEVEEVRRQTSLRALVEGVTKLRREGDLWVGLCPFHREKTPSFKVYEDQGRYHCFGCGETGDVFAFIMKTQCVSFPDAVRVLAAAARVSLSVTGSVPCPDLAKFAADRRLSRATLDRFHIRADGSGRRPALRYPTTVGIDRLKFLDGRKPKYGWATKGGRAHWYGLRSALAALGSTGTTIYIVNGDVSVWACAQAGVPALCPCSGEGVKPTPAMAEELARALRDLGRPIAVRIVYDADATGRTGAVRRVQPVLVEAGLEVAVLDIAAAVPGVEGADVDDLHRQVGDDGLAAALAGLPRLEAARAEEERESSRPKTTATLPSQAARLVKLAAHVELFHTPENEPYATIVHAGHSETYSLKSSGFRLWLQRQFHQATQKIPSAQATADALNVLMGQALFDSAPQPVFVRVAPTPNGSIMLDLGDPAWTAVEVTSTDWHLVTNPPVKFRRSRGLLALPIPVPGGRIDNLREFLNLGRDENWVFAVAWLVAALRPSGPYSILGIHGEHGSAKTNLARILRSFIDPNTAALRAQPRDDQNLVIAASNSWVIGLDNLSKVPPWLSDALCRLATGGGYGTRELYTDREEILLDVQRPVVFTSIEDLGTRDDFADRKLGVSCPPIDDNKRLTESKLYAAVDVARPTILGALLSAVSMGLRRWDVVGDGPWPRMADFAQWVTACEPALGWESGTLIRVYDAHRQESAEMVIESSAVGQVLRQFMRGQPDGWQGTAGELLGTLTALASDSTKKDAKRWPRTPRGLRGKLERLTPDLRRLGIKLEFFRDATSDRTRKVRITTVRTVQPSEDAKNRGSWTGRSPDGRGPEPSEPSGDRPNASDRNSDGSDGPDGPDGRDAALPKNASGKVVA